MPSPKIGDFFMADDRLYEAMIKKAIRLARKGEGYTSPNPIVGAVVFNGDEVISTGYHKCAGGPHAEREALLKAGDRARGASIAVNLEPCCHYGRTEPCTDAIIRAGIKEVVFSLEDPFSKVRGQGARILVSNGIKVINGPCREEAAKVNEVYLKYITTGRPFVVLKTAQSIDGRIATRTGHSQWISCQGTLKFAHKLRARYDAVAVGAGTARTDNPRLTVRHVRGKDPLRIVVTSSNNLSPRLKLFTGNEDNKTIVATTRSVISSKVYSSVKCWPVRKEKNQIDLKNLLARAGKQEVTSILFEGGAGLATSLLKRGLVDKMYVAIAPMIIGKGIETVGDLGIKSLSRAIRFQKSGFRKMGVDNIFWGYPEV
jgi:diaminohydroxyphosphoribosylaminopyrimidine deaminase/5-amino-6-(5-phosphoribosylamino)uracil reductase